MLDILSYLPGRRKTTPSGWISFNCPICNEIRTRGGIKFTDQNWTYHCFNCGRKASFILGRNVSINARQFLRTIGVPDRDIDMLNLESMKHRSIEGILDDRQRMWNQLSDIRFEERDLPDAAELITEQHAEEWQYCRQRCLPLNFEMMTVKENNGVRWTRPQVIVPFTYDNTVVGYTCRMLDGRTPKYISDSQPGYVFGTDLQHHDWRRVIVVEGVFDALSVGAVAVLHNDINDTQARLIRNLGREITVVPDQDQAGMKLVDRALELGWAVSMPEWPDDVKDVNDAVMRWGRLTTLLTIFEARQTSRIKIELRRRNLARRLA